MKQLFIAAVTAIILFSPLATLAAAPTDKASLLSAWEDLQKNDKETVVFQKTEPRHYRFETNRFPYKGEIEVLNLTIDDAYDTGPLTGAVGYVEVELKGVDEAFYRKFANSFSTWTRNNTLYFDTQQNQWISMKQWQARLRDAYSDSDATGLAGFGCRSLLSIFSGNLFWLLFLVLMVLFLTVAIRKSNRHMKAAMEGQKQALQEQDRALAIMVENQKLARYQTKLLQEIRNYLKSLSEKERKTE